MQTALRLYVNTSRGNDPFLHRELLSLRLKPKFDQHLHSFYFDAPMQALFSVSFRSLLAENLFVQLGKPFPATSEAVFSQQLDRLPFGNYLPLHRSLTQQLTLNILVRQTQYPLSDNVFSSLLANALQKQLYRKEYRELLPGPMHLLPFQDIKEIVERKWQHEDEFIPNNSPLLEGRGAQQLLSSGQVEKAQLQEPSPIKSRDGTGLVERKENNSQLSIPYQPEMTLYVRRNQARLLLKVNKQPMYKHGWKQKVGWAPIRESIIAAVLNQTQILEQTGCVRLWDPFCGSGTIALVAAAQWHGVGVRGDTAANFTWPHWRVYKPEYLQTYKQEEQQRNRDGVLQLICSDVSFQAANYAIGNLRSLASEMPSQCTSAKAAAVRLKPTDQLFDVRDKQWAVLCGDFQKVAANVLSAGPVSIVTNLPYTEGRSAGHIPLNQLVSLYRRFSQLIASQADHIQNVFLILNSQPAEISNPNHFLRVSSLQWTQVAAFQSGGKEVGLYAWSRNQLSVPYADYTALTQELLADRQAIQSLPEQADVSTALAAFRAKVKAIENKNYFVPKHLQVIRKGWKRVVQKRRQRHLLRAYDIFARRKDKMQAFAEYANRKLELAMLKRGRIWRKRNARLLTDVSLLSMEKELKAEFQGRIQEALKRSQAKEEMREKKIQEKKKEEAEKQKRIDASRPQKLKPKPRESTQAVNKPKQSRGEKQAGGVKRVWRN